MSGTARRVRTIHAGDYRAGLSHHRAGRLAEADRLYRRVPPGTASHADSLHLRGVIAVSAGRIDEAETLFRTAIAGNPRVAGYWFDLGSLLMDRPAWAEAEACFRQALALQPTLVEALVNLGIVLLQTDRLDAAIASFGHALLLDPDLAQAHLNLADALRRSGRLDEADQECRRALDLAPAIPEPHLGLGNIAMARQAFDAAADRFRAALRLAPDLPAAHINLGNALAAMHRSDDAVGCFLKAITLQPEHPDTYNNLANTLADLGKVDEALVIFAHALSIAPDYADAHANLGGLLIELDRLEDALHHTGQAVRLAPGRATAWVSLAASFRALGRLDESIACFRHAVALDPGMPTAHTNLSMALLARGDLAEGWQEYEWRGQMPELRRSFPVPQWHGEAASGQTLLVHAEQGLGDTLQFCRHVNLAAERGLTIVLEVPTPLVRLLRGLPGVRQVVATGKPLPSFDLHCPMMSLPLALGTTLETIPAACPYLRADPERVAAWRNRLAAAGDGPRVGVLWAGNSHADRPRLKLVDRRRSIEPARLSAVFDVPGIRFVGLQKDGPAAPDVASLLDYRDRLTDFAETAALVANLDLVIAVDSAVAHLAAALGRPVWLLDRFAPCWRWMTGRSDSPWYPTLRLYRQEQPGDWEPVVRRVADDLRLWSLSRSSHAA